MNNTQQSLFFMINKFHKFDDKLEFSLVCEANILLY